MIYNEIHLLTDRVFAQLYFSKDVIKNVRGVTIPKANPQNRKLCFTMINVPDVDAAKM